MTLLATGFLVDLLRRDPPALDLLRRLERGSHALRIPAVAWADLWEAAGRSRHPPRDLDRLQTLIAGYASVDLTPAHARLAGALAATHDLSLRDALVAAVAVEERDDLVVRDVRTFADIPDLRLVTY